LFGVVDIVALRENETLAVQVTSTSNFAARVRKLAEHENTPRLREAGWRIEVHAWGKRRGRWTFRKLDVS